MEVRIEEKETFTVTGIGKDFALENCYSQIPLFWQEDRGAIKGVFGVCLNQGDKIRYLIADPYLPWEKAASESVTFAKGTWAVFPIKGKLPESLQTVNTQVWNDWVPNNGEYRVRAGYSLELYAPPAEKPEDTYCEIWVPVEKA